MRSSFGTSAGYPCGESRRCERGGPWVRGRCLWPSEPCIGLPDESGYGGHGHALDQGEDQRLEEERETTARPSPGHLNELHPAPVARYPRDPGVEEGFMLEEIQVAPCLLRGVVGRATVLAALRAGEPPALPKVKVEVEPLRLDIELRPIHVPRRLEAQRHLKEIHVSHPNPTRLPRWPSDGPGSRAAPGSGSPPAAPPQPTQRTSPLAIPLRDRYPSRTARSLKTSHSKEPYALLHLRRYSICSQHCHLLPLVGPNKWLSDGRFEKRCHCIGDLLSTDLSVGRIVFSMEGASHESCDFTSPRADAEWNRRVAAYRLAPAGR